MARTQVQSELLATNSISGTIIADNAITATHIATNAISGTLIQDSGIVTTMIAANNVTATKVVTNAIQTRHIADDQVTEAKLANAINTSIAAKLPLAGGTMTGNIVMGDDTSIGIADDAERIEFDGAGDINILGANLGIGTTSPSHMLHVNAADGASDNTQAMTIENNEATDGRSYGLKIKAGSTVNDASLFVQDHDASNDHFIIRGNGAVGIGTTSPANILHVHQPDASSNAYVHITQQDGGSADTDGLSIGIEDGGVNAVIRNRENGYLRMYTNNTERMRISSTGKTSWSANGVGNVATQDRDFTFYTEGSTNGVAINSAANRIVFMGGAGSSGTGSDKGYLQLEAEGTAKVAFNSDGDSFINGGTFTIGETAPQSSSYGFNVYNDVVPCWFETRSSNSGHEVMVLNRKNSAGTMVAFAYNDSEKGTITQSGGTISYNPFMGSHYSESSEDTSAIIFGTVMETVDALVENKYEDQKRLAKCKVSSTSESPNVYGVWMEDNQTGQIAALGASWCRVNSGVTVSMGDLLVSNGDGTAKLQSDDIIRSKTIGKVTSTVKKETYSDGSYVVPVVLYCG